MKGKHKGTQALLLQINSRAFYVPCSAHSLNLVVADGVAVSYFGLIQRIYSLLSGSPKRWSILKKHVNIVPKLWSETRWESRSRAVEARNQWCI